MSPASPSRCRKADSHWPPICDVIVESHRRREGEGKEAEGGSASSSVFAHGLPCVYARRALSFSSFNSCNSLGAFTPWILVMIYLRLVPQVLHSYLDITRGSPSRCKHFSWSLNCRLVRDLAAHVVHRCRYGLVWEEITASCLIKVRQHHAWRQLLSYLGIANCMSTLLGTCMCACVVMGHMISPKVEADGGIIDNGDTGMPINPAGFKIHSAIHTSPRGRPGGDITWTMHTHTIETVRCGCWHLRSLGVNYDRGTSLVG